MEFLRAAWLSATKVGNSAILRDRLFAPAMLRGRLWLKKKSLAYLNTTLINRSSLSVLTDLPERFHKKALSVLKKQLEGLVALE